MMQDENYGERRLAAAVLIQAIKDRDWEWLLSDESSAWWQVANYEQPTTIPKNLVIKTQVHLFTLGGVKRNET